MHKLSTLAIFGLFISLGVFGQENNPPEITESQEEAPAALFDVDLDDESVQYEFSGSWISQLSFGLGGEFTPQGSNFLNAYPGINRGVVFTQAPNVVLDLWLYESYFFQGQYQGDEGSNEFALGYRGTEEDWLRLFQVGNRPGSIRPFAGLTSTSAPGGTPSLIFRTSSDDIDADLLLRYRNTGKKSLSFRGDQEIDIIWLSPQDYLPNQWFTVPGSPANIEVWRAEEGGTLSESSTGSTFSILEDSEYSYLDGVIQFSEPQDRSLLLHYTGITPYLDPATGYTLNTITASDARNYLLLQRGRQGSVLELKNRYSLQSPYDSDGSVRIELVDRGTNEIIPLSGRSLTLIPGESHFLFQGTSGQEAFPFLSDYPLLYDPGLTDDFFPAQAFRVESQGGSKGYRLGNNIIPESIEVTVAGRRTQNFVFNEITGILTIGSPVYPQDLVIIRYQEEFMSGQISEEISLIHSGAWKAGDYGVLEWNSLLDWTFPEENYSTAPGQYPGSFQASALWMSSFGPLEYKLSLRGSLQTEDVSGSLSLDGFDPSNQTIVWDPGRVLPSPVPQFVQSFTAPKQPWWSSATDWWTFFGVSQPTAATRGRLYFQDHLDVDALGNEFRQAYDWSGSSLLAYQDGGFTGPYVAGGDSTVNENVLSLEYELNGPRNWVGAQVNSSTLLDLSRTSEIRFSLRNEGEAPTGLVILLMAGELGEDINGDGTLISPYSGSPGGFRFVDQVETLNLTVPRQTLTTLGNDANGNGVLEGDNADSLLIKEISTLPLAGSGWSTISFPLTSDERSFLSKTSGVRILIFDTDGGSNSGEFLFSPITFVGAGLSTTGEVSLTSTAESSLSPSPSSSLSSKLQRTLAPGDNQVLQLQWSGGTSDWSIQGDLKESSPDHYRYFDLYYFLSAAGGTPTFSLKVNGQGLLNFQPPVSTDWERLRIDLQEETWTAGGLSGSLSLPKDSLWKSWSLEMSGGGPSGTLILDEVGFSQALVQGDWGSQLLVRYPWTGITGWLLLEEGEINLLQNFENPGFYQAALSSSMRGQDLSLDLGLEAEWEGAWSGALQYDLHYLSESWEAQGEFDSSGFKRESWRLFLPFKASLEVSYGALGEQGEKKWYADMGTPEEGPLDLHLSSTLKQVSNQGSNPQDPGELWIQRWQAYNPGDWNSWSTFLWNLEGTSGYNTEEWYFDLILDQEMGYAQGTAPLQNHRWALDASTLWVQDLRLGGTTVNLSWVRTLSLQDEANLQPWTPLLSHWVEGSQTAYPQVFSLWNWEAVLPGSGGRWTKEDNLSFAFQKRQFVDWLDWLVPVGLIVNLSNSWVSQESSAQNLRQSYILDWRAFSLLGNQGLYGVFEWFLREELQNSVNLTIDNFDTISWIFDSHLKLFTQDDSRFFTKNTLHGDEIGVKSFTNSLGLELNFLLEDEVSWLWIPWEPERVDRWVHSPDISLEYVFRGENTGITEFSAGWTSTLKLGLSSSFEAYIKGGILSNGENRLWGAETGIILALFF